MIRKLVAISSLVFATAACQNGLNMSQTSVNQQIYGKLPDGREVKLFTLTNRNGVTAKVMEYGAILVSLEAPDKNGKIADVAHGFDTLNEWVDKNDPYFGTTVGRYGNRIAHGRFTLDGKTYQLTTNNDPGGIPCALHGGVIGFHKKLWKGMQVDDETVEFTYTSPDGEEGYPGNLSVSITYSLNDRNELRWEAAASTDAPTVLNLVHHSYWNLAGDSKSILNHQLTLNAPYYLPTDKGLIPTGEIAPVKGTPMDFSEARVIGKSIDDKFEALTFGGGYDHCWVLPKDGGIQHAARLFDPSSGRVMDIHTDQPGIQFYAGNFMDGGIAGKDGIHYAKRSALCLETQNFPDAPNQPDFPSPVLRPGEVYKHVMIHRFSAVK